MSGGHPDDDLSRIRQAALDVRSFVEGLSREAFLDDKRTHQAVVLSLLVIGEAATKIMDRHGGFAAAHPEIPWRSMRGMRNRIAHGYYDMDLDVVWETTQTAVPDLIALLSRGASDA